MGDWGALRQVIDNLLANVRAHTPVGTKVSVRVGREGPEAFIEVADTGPGISEEQSEAVFERFFRVDSSRSRETGGAGLGLAIVATILRVHGGRATAGSRPGGGAIFRVVLPVLDEVGVEVV
jgi:two-component system OmpR family sensor kinase